MEKENTSAHSNGGSSTITTTNSYNPTTFIQADATTFKQVVQMLTGCSTAAPAKQPSKTDTSAARGGGGGIPPIKSTGQKKQGFKLYERRNSLKNGLMMIDTAVPGLVSSRKPETLSPSVLDFPALVLSPATPLNEDAAVRRPSTSTAAVEEDKAIAEKKFYFHPSPRMAAASGVAAPQLLPLFPVTSPRVSGSS